jgi:predicted DNA-binding protein with PD1-like motif
LQSEEENNVIVIKLDNGENLLDALLAVIDKHNITSALILSGIGMLRDLEIGYYNGQNYINETFVDPMELLSMHGSVAKGDESKIHIHVSLASSEHKVYGGHLNKASVCILNEIVILKLNEITLSRKLNEKSGLLELVVSK